MLLLLLALPYCDTGRHPNNHTNVNPSRTYKTNQHLKQPSNDVNVMTARGEGADGLCLDVKTQGCRTLESSFNVEVNRD